MQRTDAYHHPGDVNLFFNDPDDASAAEIEVMIAEQGSRRRGLASEALMLLMAYAVTHLGVTRFVAKIGEDNTPSLLLFRAHLGYQDLSHSAVFREHTLMLDTTSTELGDKLRAAGAHLILGTYDGGGSAK
jgi:Acetyltransferase (GNAT) domain